MLKRSFCDVRMDLSIDVKGPVLIKAGDSGVTGPDMSFVRTHGYGLGKPYPYLPGTSLKGVIRSYCERIARTLVADRPSVCLPYQQQPHDEQSCGKRLEKTKEKTEVYRQQCMVCKLFGSLQFKGRIGIRDAYSPNPKAIVEEVRDGVAIDRKTGGAASGAKYDLEVVTAGQFRTQISIDNFEIWQLGLLGLVLNDLCDERIRLGMGTSRGLGHVSATLEQATIRLPMTHGSTLAGIERLVSPDIAEAYGLFKGRQSMPDLGNPQTEGLWNTFTIAGDALNPIWDATRDEFLEFTEGYQWIGGAA